MATKLRQRYYITPGNAVKAVDNAMPCDRTGYDRPNIRPLATQQHEYVSLHGTRETLVDETIFFFVTLVVR